MSILVNLLYNNGMKTQSIAVCNPIKCNSSMHGLKYCNKHYTQVRKFGHILTPDEMTVHRAKEKGVCLNSGKSHFKKGIASWNSGRKWTEKSAENHHYWKGDKVSYRALHSWVERNLGKGDTCENCKTSGLKSHSIHWSNISGEYKRDLSDWQRLCASCHGAYDSGKLTLAEIRG